MRMKRKKAKMKNEKEKRMRRNDFGDGLMFDRSLLDWRSTKRRENDRGGRMVIKKERLRGCGKEKGRSWRRRCFMEEERGKEIQGGKRM